MKKYLKKISFVVLLMVLLGLSFHVHANFNPTGGKTYKLSGSIGTTNTTINLTSFTEPVSGTPYTMTYLQSDIGYGTLDPQNVDKSEFISFTGVTQNTNGSAVLTGVTRGLTRTPSITAGCTASSTLKVAHPSQSAFILSDNPCLFTQYAVKQNNETITGSWSIPTPTTANNPATKAYVDLVVGGITTTDKITVAGTAGETFSTGAIVFLRQSDARWYKASTTSAVNAIVGIAQGSGSAGVSISGGVLMRGLDANQSGLIAGSNYFASTTAGSLGLATSTIGLGMARNTTNLYFDPTFAIAGQNNFFSGSTTAATSTVTIGSFPIYQIGKNEFLSTTTGASTFTVPTGITKVWFEMAGGGGGGGSPGSNAGAGGGGGGAGGYCTGIIDLTGISTISYTIGTAGAGGSGTSGTDGGYSFMTSGANTYCSAGSGGSGGSDGSGSSVTSGKATTTVATVTTFNGTIGGYGLDTGTIGFSGMGGSNRLGAGGSTVAGGASALSGNAGQGFGAGGSGSVSAAAASGNGGNGTGGLLRIRW